jgi:CHAD domain-containing protein
MGPLREAGGAARELAGLPAFPTAGDVVREYLRRHVGELLRHESFVRTGDAHAVHRMRVATRRLRSVLATYRPLLDRTRTDPVRAELRWLADALGGVRDNDVLEARLQEALAELPPDLVSDTVAARIDEEMAARRREARGKLLDALDDRRYVRLLDSLEELAGDPPRSGRAARPATTELSRLAARAVRRVQLSASAAAGAPGAVDVVAAVDGPGAAPGLSELLHVVRKDAKRARYAAEAAEPVAGKKATRLARRMRAVQDVLGEHHDSVVARTRLRDMAEAARQSGEDTFTFGVLHEAERVRGETALAAYPAAIRAALKARPRRWTS